MEGLQISLSSSLHHCAARIQKEQRQGLLSPTESAGEVAGTSLLASIRSLVLSLIADRCGAWYRSSAMLKARSVSCRVARH